MLGAQVDQLCVFSTELNLQPEHVGNIIVEGEYTLNHHATSFWKQKHHVQVICKSSHVSELICDRDVECRHG